MQQYISVVYIARKNLNRQKNEDVAHAAEPDLYL